MCRRTISVGIALWLLCSCTVYSQVTFNVWSNNYIQLQSYLGLETNERFNTFQFEIPSLQTNIPNWSLGVQLLGAITATSGVSTSDNPFPPDKISFRWSMDSDDPYTNLSSIGADRNYIMLQQANNVMLVNRSRVPLSAQGNYGYRFMLYGSIKIAAGAYLDDYISADPYQHMQYTIPLAINLYDQQGNVLASQKITYILQIPPKLQDANLVDVAPDYSLVVSSSASDVTLRFSNAQDYQQGVFYSLPQAVEIYSKTNFELRVKSLDPYLVSSTAQHTLPLSILSVGLEPAQGARPVSVRPDVTISTEEQVLLSGSGSEGKRAQYFDMHYKARLASDQVVLSRPGNYSVSLLYLLMPK